MRTPSFGFVLVAMLPLSAFAAKHVEAAYHAPTTDAEKRLDVILRTADADEQNAQSQAQRYTHGQYDYSQMLTKRLMARVLKHENATVNRECSGGEHGGQRCVADYVPLSCIQDVGTNYVYKTTSQSGKSAHIAYSWASLGNGKDAKLADYAMVNDHGVWKIDNILCKQHDGDRPSSSWAPLPDTQAGY